MIAHNLRNIMQLTYYSSHNYKISCITHTFSFSSPTHERAHTKTHTYVCVCVCVIYIYIYREREREREIRVAQSVQRLPTGWTVRGSNPCGARFSAPVQTGPEAHPASCTIGTGSFPGVRCGRGVTLTPHSFQCRGLKQSRAIPLLSLKAFVACERGKPTYKNYLLRSALICDITQHRVVTPQRRFGTTYRLYLQRDKPLKMGPIGRPANVSTKLPLYASQYSRRRQISSTSRWESENTQLTPLFNPPFFATLMLLPQLFALQYTLCTVFSSQELQSQDQCVVSRLNFTVSSLKN